MLQYLKIPANIDVEEIKSSAVRKHKAKQKASDVILSVIAGSKISDLNQKFGASTVRHFIVAVRERGIERHLVRKTRKNYTLSLGQRSILLAKANEFIARSNSGERFTLNDLRKFVKDEFAIEYSYSNIYAYVRRNKLKWNFDNEKPRSLNETQLGEYKKYCDYLVDRIKNGEWDLTKNTVKDWVMSELGVSISLATVATYNKKLGIVWPEKVRRKIAQRTGIPTRGKVRPELRADQ